MQLTRANRFFPAVVEQPKTAGLNGLETYAGEVRARYESVLGFRIGGKVEQRFVDVGAKVRRGDVIATLEPEDANLAVTQARAGLAAAKADVALAKAELDRHATLLEKSYISQALFDARKNQHEAAEARFAQAVAQLSVAQNNAGYTQLTADQDGVVTQLMAGRMSTVRAQVAVTCTPAPWLLAEDRLHAEKRNGKQGNFWMSTGSLELDGSSMAIGYQQVTRRARGVRTETTGRGYSAKERRERRQKKHEGKK